MNQIELFQQSKSQTCSSSGLITDLDDIAARESRNEPRFVNYIFVIYSYSDVFFRNVNVLNLCLFCILLQIQHRKV